MSLAAQHLAHATSLLAAIRATAPLSLPRREELELWLGDFLRRAAVKGFHVEAADADNLQALDKFVRANQVPVVAA